MIQKFDKDVNEILSRVSHGNGNGYTKVGFLVRPGSCSPGRKIISLQMALFQVLKSANKYC